jgi:Ca2+-binding RTX toxin-like protein
MMRTTRRTAAALALTLGTLGATAAAASAGTLSASGTTVTYDAKAGETNHVTVTQNGDSVTVKDGSLVIAGAGCTGSPVHCDLASVKSIVVKLGNKDDTLDASAVTAAMTVDGDAGDDDITTGDGADKVHGNTGADSLHGSKGNDHLIGDPGNDHLFGQNGADTLEGNTGDDHVNGGADNDSLDGGDGKDTLTGNDGKDTFTGAGGSDDIEAQDGVGSEHVDCGSTAFDDDFARVDAGDIVANDCDRVQH